MTDREQTTDGGLHAGRPVKGKSLHEQVVESLRWSIFIGELPPGRRFSVPALAEQFGVSPTPVREAVLDLVQQGLVAPLANRGFEVVPPTMEYLTQAMHVRRLLEIPAMVQIAGNATPDQIRPVRDLADAIMAAAREGQDVVYGVRPKNFRLASESDAASVEMVVEVVEPTGDEIEVISKIADTRVCAVFTERHAFKPEERVHVAPLLETVHLFDAKTGLRING